MINAIWITEQSLLDLGRGTVVERLVRQLDDVAVGVPERLLDQLPPLNCHKYVVESEEELHKKIHTYFGEREEIVSVPGNRVRADEVVQEEQVKEIDIANYHDLEVARELVRAEAPKVVFVGQRLYFGKQVSRDAAWAELAQGVGNWSSLLNMDADLFIFFMPHHLPVEVKKRLGGIKVGVHAEPLPKHVDGKYLVSEDLYNRLIQMTAAFDFKYLYHHDKTSFPILEREGVRVKEFISAVDTSTYFPETRKKKWVAMFYGRETEHRLNTMMAAKHQLGGKFLHIAHGIDGAELNRFQNMSVIGVNCHTENIPALENRMQVMMASGLFVLSEPLSHNGCFVPGEHFIEYSGANDLVHKIRYYLEHGEERKEVAQAGLNLVRRELAARVKWPQLIDEVMRSEQAYV